LRFSGAEMADDLTPKQEAFALAYLETGNAAEAYRRAYDVSEDARDSWIYVEAWQVLNNPKVALRLKTLQDQAARLSIFNVAAAATEYEEARQLAMKEANPSAAVAAVTGKVKLFGLDKPSRIEMTGKDSGPIQVEEIKRDADAFASRMARLTAGAAATGVGEPNPTSEGGA
jgi:phage terminase small subunit